MRVTSNDNHSTQNNHTKGVTFDAMETLERNSDCIDRLTSLVSIMKMTNGQKTVPIQTKNLSKQVQESKYKLTKFYTQK